ncbi:unnamed protein product [Prorocentrum cordatum]|uniref:Protein kinase domain-containing protein n=1 Tax=Prorocentrum cordatum TaxID=2364126 RepID=A0ABN9XXJ6_9DINO|nr:unnamed protein product [Polarella glacialis]
MAQGCEAQRRASPVKDMTGAPIWYVVFEALDGERTAVLDELSQLGCIRGNLERSYSPRDEIVFGRGANASVSRMYHRGLAQVVAVKKMNSMMELDAIERELATLLQVQLHPNVIGCHGIFWSVEEELPRFSLVLEAALAGDMLNQVLHVGVLTEPKAKPLFAGMMQGLAHLHDWDIVHRDIKAENILLVSEETGVRAVIADFGLATWLSDSVQMARRCGSPGYVAPEVCVGTPYGLNVDVFGAGVVLFFMLSKDMPFVSRDRDTAATMRKTVKCALHLHRPPFDAMSSRVRGMLRETICKSPDDRLSSERCFTPGCRAGAPRGRTARAPSGRRAPSTPQRLRRRPRQRLSPQDLRPRRQ